MLLDEVKHGSETLNCGKIKKTTDKHVLVRRRRADSSVS